MRPSATPFWSRWMAKMLPAKGCLIISCAESPLLAVVTYKVFRSEPPNAQAVTFDVGKVIVLSTLPSGAMRITQPPANRAFHTHPSWSMAAPSGRPAAAQALRSTRDLKGSAVAKEITSPVCVSAKVPCDPSLLKASAFGMKIFRIAASGTWPGSQVQRLPAGTLPKSDMEPIHKRPVGSTRPSLSRIAGTSGSMQTIGWTRPVKGSNSARCPPMPSSTLFLSVKAIQPTGSRTGHVWTLPVVSLQKETEGLRTSTHHKPLRATSQSGHSATTEGT